LLLSFAEPCIAGTLPELTFSSATEVSPRSVITAYDIVEGRHLNEDVIEQLRAIQLGDEKTNRIEKNDLAKQLRHLKAKFVLPSEVKMMRSRNAVSRMEVERKIRNQLAVSCQDCEVKIQISSVPSQLLSDWSMDMNIDLNKASLLIPIYSNSEPDKKGWVVAEVKRYQTVPVLNRALKAFEVITADFLTFEKRLVSNWRETVLNKDSLIGMQATRFMNAGQSFLFSDLKKEQVLQRGQVVKAIVGSESFEVSISAQAEENGAIGDMVRVKNLDSQKIFAAKVIDRGVVRIE